MRCGVSDTLSFRQICLILQRAIKILRYVKQRVFCDGNFSAGQERRERGTTSQRGERKRAHSKGGRTVPSYTTADGAALPT